MTFPAYPKTPRLDKPIIVTEKIDGTNGLVAIEHEAASVDDGMVVGQVGDLLIRAGSRSRWLLPGKTTDNFGFAAWVQEHAEKLAQLGPGLHYGEWWGQGIQRGYGLDHKRFSLFRVDRYEETELPDCCHLVPVLYRGPFSTSAVRLAADDLCRDGSRAAPGFMRPEGVVVFHTAARQVFKHIIEKDAA